MLNKVIKRAVKDEIKEPCVQCGIETLVAYWDEELEYYIYMSDSPICSACEIETIDECEVV